MDGAKRWVVADGFRTVTDPIELADRVLEQIPFVPPGLRHEILTRIEALRSGGNDTLLCSGLLAEIDEEYLGTHVPLRWLEREEATIKSVQADKAPAEEDVREIAARSPEPPSTPKRRWCGRCDRRDRLITPAAEGPRRCPECHPLGREPINGDLSTRGRGAHAQAIAARSGNALLSGRPRGTARVPGSVGRVWILATAKQ